MVMCFLKSGVSRVEEGGSGNVYSSVRSHRQLRVWAVKKKDPDPDPDPCTVRAELKMGGPILYQPKCNKEWNNIRPDVRFLGCKAADWGLLLCWRKNEETLLAFDRDRGWIKVCLHKQNIFCMASSSLVLEQTRATTTKTPKSHVTGTLSIEMRVNAGNPIHLC